MAILEKIESNLDVINYFKELPFYNKYTEKPKFKPFKIIDLPSELPFMKN